MPFDSASEITPMANVLDRLRQLRKIADRSHGRQSEWRCCLWSEVRRDTLMIAAGLSPSDHPNPEVVSSFFGLNESNYSTIFGADEIALKRLRIDQLIAAYE